MMLIAASNPLLHVVQHPVWEPGGFTLFSNHVLMQLITAGLLLYFLPRFVRQRAGADDVGRHVPHGWGNAIEGICEALRKYVARPALGPYTDRFIPYIWSVFFFILISNLLGIIPLSDWVLALGEGAPFLGFLVIGPPGHGHSILGGTSTANIWVTAMLATCTLFMIVYNGLRLHGMDYVKHFFMGPVYLAPLIAFLEIVGLFAKTFALAVRLFANMVAGHVMLAVIIGFVSAAAVTYGTIAAVGVSIPVILGAVALTFLELFVAFLQAFIFTFLSAMFIGQAVVLHHEHDDHEPHEDEVEAPSGTPALGTEAHPPTVPAGG